MTGATDLARMVPGFDFLQGLLKNAGSGLPHLGQWVAPTLNPEELEKRIQELKTVQFWLEQNAKLLSTTIQAMEVQRMTLATLQTMNLPLADISNALKLKPLGDKAAAPAPAPAAAVDPQQWWGALTQQFTELAGKAMKDSAVDATKNLAGAMVKQTLGSASGVIKKAARTAAQVPSRSAPAKRKR
jgi:hypothetical protein